MDDPKLQVADRIKQANNILVTVSTNPSVDQLAACIGLTLSLNKMGKHATAVFSGDVPSTIEFLQPEKTIEKNTDSLRDFIIALDKSKADKLRYKVEDRVVKIFITPYRTSISDKDLEFSQGDFNVDVVVAIGVHSQAELDQAITSHGRILHDATVMTLNVRPGGELGSVNWLDASSSSLSEMTVQLVDLLDKKLLDGQIATALLTGIVAETERFSNAKTSSQTMGISAELMSVGANQQLVATKLEEPAPPPPQARAPIATQQPAIPAPGDTEAAPAKKSDDGTLEIAHDDKAPSAEPTEPEEKPEGPQEPAESPAEPTPAPKEPAAEEPKAESVPEFTPEPSAEDALAPPPQIHIDEHGALRPVEDEDTLPPLKPHEPPSISHHNEPPKMILEPPTLGGEMTASGAPDKAFNGGDTEENEAGLPGMPQHEIPMLGGSDAAASAPPVGPTIIPPTDPEPQNAPGTSFLGDQPLLPSAGQGTDADNKDAAGHANETLSEIERDVNSSHLTQSPPGDTMLPPVPVVSPETLGSAPAPTPATPAGSFLPPAAPAPSPISVLPPAAPDNPLGDLGSPATPTTTDAAAESSGPTVDSARDAVNQAINGAPSQAIDPIQALNAHPVNLSLNGSTQDSGAPAPGNGAPAAPQYPATPVIPWTPPESDPLPPGINLNAGDAQPAGLPQTVPDDPNAPPPVPPPMMPVSPA